MKRCSRLDGGGRQLPQPPCTFFSGCCHCCHCRRSKPFLCPVPHAMPPHHHTTTTHAHTHTRTHTMTTPQDDMLIKAEGLDSLTEDELRTACKTRGMKTPYGPGAAAFMRQQMKVGCVLVLWWVVLCCVVRLLDCCVTCSNTAVDTPCYVCYTTHVQPLAPHLPLLACFSASSTNTPKHTPYHHQQHTHRTGWSCH